MRVLGHDFRPMTDHDWMGFAGAEPGTLICYVDDATTLLFDPATRVVSEVICTEDGEMGQEDWTPSRVV